jgi:hypothetical protein
MQNLAKISALIGLVLLTSASPALTQSLDATWKEGAFRTCEDFWAGKLLYKGPFEFSYIGTQWLPEHFDEITTFNKLKAKDLIEIWALYQEDCLFLNLHRLGMGHGFIRLREPRYFTHFIGVPMTFTIIKPSKVNCILDLRTGQVNEVTDGHMLRILEPYPKLYNAYRMDTETDKLDIILLYIELLNDAIEFGEN